MRSVNCKVCETPFEATSYASKLCSDECRNVKKLESRTKWRSESEVNRKRWCEYSNNYRKRNPNRSRFFLLRSSCKSRGLPFDLEEQFFHDIPEVCPVLGIPLDGRDRDHQWSIDRIVPDKGYVQGNVKIISMRANRLKNDSTLTEIKSILRYMEENT